MFDNAVKVSVVIPVFNREESIELSISSVEKQTYFESVSYEIIVVDDGSTDNTIQKVNSRQKRNSNLKLISTDGRKGASYARNLGANEAKGEWLFFQDSDDVWLPNKVERQLEIVLKESMSACFCSFIRIDKNVVNLYPDFLPKKKYLYSEKDFKYFVNKNPVSTQCLALKNKLFHSLGGFDESLPRFQDWEFVLRLIQNHDIHFLDEPLVNVFVSEDSITKNYLDGVKARECILLKHERILKSKKMFFWFRLQILVRRLFGVFR